MEASQAQTHGLFFSKGKSYPACFESVQNSFSSNSGVELKRECSIDEIEYAIKAGNKCLMILTVCDREDLSLITHSLLNLKRELKERKAVAIVFMNFTSDKIEELLTRSGVSDILRFETSAKAFAYKINRHLKVLDQEQMTNDRMELLAGKHEDDADSGLRALKAKSISDSRKSRIEIVDELSGKQDFWIFGGKKFARRQREAWMIEMIGPSPQAGTWEKVREDLWRWMPNAAYPQFQSQVGHWEFTGKKPVYNGMINRWGFVSGQAALSLVENGEIILNRFRLFDPFHLKISANSLHAKSLFLQIQSTFSKVREKHVDQHDLDLPWSMEGDTAHLSAQHWAGQAPAAVEDDTTLHLDAEDFSQGADAMKPCGLKGLLNDLSIDLLEYEEGSSTLRIGLGAAEVTKKDIVDISVALENLGAAENFKLRGVVMSVEPDEVTGEPVALVLMLQDSTEEFKKISQSIAKRQEEVFAFFRKVKGLESAT